MHKAQPTPDELYQKYIQAQHHSSTHHQYTPDEYGVWEVRGEGDERGYGSVIGYYEGNLHNVIRFSVIQPRFWSYGSGGHFAKLDVKKITAKSVDDQLQLTAEKERLEAELARINDRLKELK